MIRKLSTMRGRRTTRVFRRLATFGAALVALSAGLVGVAQPATAGMSCGNVYIVNAYNGLVVSAELGYTGSMYGTLRARSGSAGPWEKFQRCIDQSNNLMTLKSLANNRYVSVEMNYTGSFQYTLRARATTVGLWEQFYLYATDSWYLDGFKSRANGLFVSTEMGYPSSSYQYMLRARASSLGNWEKYRIGPL